LAHIGEKSGLGEFAVGDDIDAALHLFPHHIADRVVQRLLISLFVVRLPGIFRLHRIQQPVRPRQAADMGRLDAVGVLLQLHGLPPNLRGSFFEYQSNQSALTAGLRRALSVAHTRYPPIGYRASVEGKTASLCSRLDRLKTPETLHTGRRPRRKAAFYDMVN